MGANTSCGASRRRFLFLQGPVGLFFSRLAAALRDRGHRISRINLHGGDRLFWRLPECVDYAGEASGWPEFVDDCLRRGEITDVVLFGDCRPMHAIAVKAARARSIPVHVFEEGYLRPDWITLEPDGVNANSSLPLDPEYYRRVAPSVPPIPAVRRVADSFLRRAVDDLTYHVTMDLTRPKFRGYRSHRPRHPYVDYLHGIPRYLRKPIAAVRAQRVARELRRSVAPYFIFPLQLDADAQIRVHSPFGSMQPAIEHVIRSFATGAPADTMLVLTEHPFEPGVVDFRRIATRAAECAGIGRRLIYLEGGTPADLLARCQGLVTVNSTVGLQALELGAPVFALGRAVYAIAGLTFQGGLPIFWRQPVAPDRPLLEAFRRVIVARSQLNGGYYSATGIALAVGHSVARLERAVRASGLL
jgi:capsular polysaccharide export protein